MTKTNEQRLYEAHVKFLIDCIENGEPYVDNEGVESRRPVSVAFVGQVNAFLKNQGITADVGAFLEQHYSPKFTDLPFSAEDVDRLQ